MKLGCESRGPGMQVLCCVLVVLLAGLLSAATAHAQWPQWGGPQRDFTVETSGLADSWPAEGPPKLWHRPLGDGYSTILYDNGVLYTMYRKETGSPREYTVALDAKTGKTLWEHENSSPTNTDTEIFGFGPNSTPLLVGDRLFSLGANALLQCFDKRTGKVLWKCDLYDQFGGFVPYWSYSCSMIAYGDTIIVPVDRERTDRQPPSASSTREKKTKTEPSADGQALVAFDQTTGKVCWKSQDFAISHSSPILVDFENEPQLVLLLESGIMGVAPADGKLLWHEAYDRPEGNMSTPLWLDGHLLFTSSPGETRLYDLKREDGKIMPKLLWRSRKLHINHANAIRFGDHILGSSGADPAYLVCLELKTGKRAWIKRGFGKTTCIAADGKLIMLEEDGHLYLASVTAEDLKIHSKCQVAEKFAWAAPTLVGTTLYVRERKHIMALDLG